ncbi:sugar phosphorylase [Thalassotalea ponticola]|uniref:sugar phosphorylase n=1 Tax=Thalassotalea ponticola TaxID=1523392 RepID=UPI0025B3D01E|nr:sugar phosphorylase [Thalassotalea ponticola]MDN3653357.1 sugar phosphorylase [Thalassotalea ponticola]
MDSTTDSNTVLSQLKQRLSAHLAVVYQDADINALSEQLVATLTINGGTLPPAPYTNLWHQQDVFLITYADSIEDPPQAPLATLDDFLDRYLADTISSVHILPFYPYSSDDGFAVIDYYQVNQSHGDWHHIQDLAGKYRIMADVVINHCSSRSGWFENFKRDIDPGKDYFFTAEPTDDTSDVVRPRTHPLLREVQTVNGIKHVWCTFSHDQVDFDFRNPQVLLEFVAIIKFYLDQGITVFRFDAVAFVWKQSNTNCINLPQTHELIKVLRLLVEHYCPTAVIITETNVPSRQNLMYFGNANEAHAIYNFSLPPLLLNTLITGDCTHLKTWLMSLPPAQQGTTYFNFLASHDGIGLRPVEGLLSQNQTDELINTMTRFGAKISWRALKEGINQPYEINITLFDALQGTSRGVDNFHVDRFICAHAIMLAIEGIPAIYLHSFLATSNDYERVKHSGQNRAINRHKWHYPTLKQRLDEPFSEQHKVLSRLKYLISIRKQQVAFHPNATQFTLHLGTKLFAFWRQSLNRQQSIFAINNISDQPQMLRLSDINLIEGQIWVDLISGYEFSDLYQTITLAPYQSIWLSNQKI